MHDHGHVRSLLEFVRFDQVRLSFIQGCIKFRIPPPGGGGNWFQNRKLLGREIKKREGKKGKGKEKKKGREGEKRREGEKKGKGKKKKIKKLKKKGMEKR